MNRWPESSATPATVLMLAVILAGAALAGTVTAYLGSAADTRAIYYVGVLGLIGAGALVAITRPEPLRFIFLAMVVFLPIATVAVPPARFEITVFDVAATVLAIGLVGKRLSSVAESGPLFPTGSLLTAWLIAIPCVAASMFPVVSLKMFVLTFALYAFFLLLIAELKRPGGFERLTGLLSIVMIVMALGCFAEYFLHVNLSLRGVNLNQLSYVDAGYAVYRVGGFFQDPQKAAAWLACMISFLLVLTVRGRFRDGKLRFLVWSAIVLGLVALITTVSRAAIAACLTLSVLALFAFNRWSAASKVATLGGAALAGIAAALVPLDVWLDMLPTTVVDRFQQSGVEFAYRMTIWFDTWRMFSEQPLTGVGFGGFREYLMATQPAVTDYYGLGESAGIGYIPDNPESGYFKVLYEGGILGSIAVLIVGADALRRALGLMVGRDSHPDARSEVIAALVGLLVFAVTFVTLFTIADHRIGALIGFFLAVIWHRSLERARAAASPGKSQWNRR
jgi:O-antigen ligase